MGKKPFYRSMIFQMLLAIILGLIVGYAYPDTGAALNPLAIGFVKLIRMVVALIIFTTVTAGIAKMGNLNEVGRIGIRSLIYFEAVSTVALVLGLVVTELLQPGVGMNINPASIDTSGMASIQAGAKALTTVGFLLNVIPNTAIDAFTQGNILQVLLLALFFGFALGHAKERGKPIVDLLERTAELIFSIVAAIMKVAPVAVFGAVAYTIGKFGFGSLLSLGRMVGTAYLTSIIFIVVVLGGVSRFTGFSLWKFLRYIREEIVLVFATASSEAGLPRLIDKLEHAGCEKSVVGFTVPTGYSFNLDGSSIYLTVAAIFIAQATNTHLSLTQELTLLAVFLLTSKGVAGVTAAGFVTLAATLTMLPDIPVAGLALLLGIDRFCDAMRSATNLIGNGVATMAIAKWEGARDDARMTAVLNGEAVEPLTTTETALAE